MAAYHYVLGEFGALNLENVVALIRAADSVAAPQPRSELAVLSPFQQGKGALGTGMVPIKLSANESHFGPSPHAIAAYHAAAANLFRYPDGTQTALREAIASTFAIDADHIVCGNGSDELLQLLVRAYVRAGDGVVFSRYSFAMAIVHATGAGAQLVIAEEPQWRPDTDQLLAAVTPQTRLMFLASPNNPVGQYLSRSELLRLHAGLRPDVLLVLDGAYADYVTAEDFDAGHRLVTEADNVVVTRTFSKLYGLAGLRIGWAHAPAGVIDAVQRIRTPFNASGPAMAAATAAVLDHTHTQFVRASNARALQRLQDGVATRLAGVAFVPSAANFYLLRFIDGTHTAHGAAAALEGAGIIPRPVGASGPEGCLRITVGLEHENEAVLRVLAGYLAR